MARPRIESVARFPLSAALGNESNVRVLRQLSVHPVSASVIVRHSKLAKASVAGSLVNLETLGFAKSFGSQRTILWMLRREHPLMPAIEALFDAERQQWFNIIDAIKSAARGLQQPGVLAVWLYGSVARGDDGPNSDLDVAIVAEETEIARLVEELRDSLAEAAALLGFRPSVVGVSKIDIARMERQNAPWWSVLKRDGQVMLGPRPDQILGRASPDPQDQAAL